MERQTVKAALVKTDAAFAVFMLGDFSSQSAE